MDAQHITQLKKTLIDEKNRIESELAQIAVQNPAIKGDWVARSTKMTDSDDSLDEQAHSVTDLEERRAVEQSLELRLKEIQETLYKIDAGTYGMCANCKNPIEKKRLVAMPASIHCAPCAQIISSA